MIETHSYKLTTDQLLELSDETRVKLARWDNENRLKEPPTFSPAKEVLMMEYFNRMQTNMTEMALLREEVARKVTGG